MPQSRRTVDNLSSVLPVVILFSCVCLQSGACGGQPFRPAQSSGTVLYDPRAEHSIAPNSYGNYAPLIGAPDLALSIAMGSSDFTRNSKTRGANAPVSAWLDAAVATETDVPQDVDVGSDIGRLWRRSGIHPSCDLDRLVTRLQGETYHWTERGTAASPIQLLASSLPVGQGEIANEGDTLDTERSERSFLGQKEAGGGWCRPEPVPFGLSSPLSSNAVQMALGMITIVFLIFILTRGVRMPPVSRQR